MEISSTRLLCMLREQANIVLHVLRSGRHMSSHASDSPGSRWYTTMAYYDGAFDEMFGSFGTMDDYGHLATDLPHATPRRLCDALHARSSVAGLKSDSPWAWARGGHGCCPGGSP